MEKYQVAYFVGIGGIGMSALAQLYQARGIRVLGSDRAPSPATKLLNEKGINVYIGHHAQNVPEQFDVLIYSDAVPFENEERALARSRGILERSYFQALGDVTREYKTIAVAGSHGKTTTTALLSFGLREAGVNATEVVGSLVTAFRSNFVLGDPEAPFVVEACEYRDHILELSPSILVVTNLEWDHTDYFKNFEQLKQTFKTAIEKLPKDGVLVVNLETDIGKELASYVSCVVVDYSTEEVPPLRLLGDFNIQNAKAARAVARAYGGVDLDSFNNALAQFTGTWRRFEYKGITKNGAEVYDDYAHHPTEVANTVKAVREKFPNKKIVVAFHPHLYSRTRDLMGEFTTAFKGADHVLVAPIYAAREAPIEGVTSAVLAENISRSGTLASAYNSLGEVEQALRTYDVPDTVLMTMGAGDIYTILDTLTV